MKNQFISRRKFFGGAGIGAAALWIPKNVKGYSSGDVRAVTVGSNVQPGISKWELETPALCVDLDKLEQNLNKVRRTLTGTGIAARPHAKTHKCPAIARMQMDYGSVGICTAKLSEAEAMHEHGISQILLTTCNVTPSKIRRAMSLRKWCTGFIQSVDNPENAQDLSDAATEAGVVADVVVDVDPGMGRTGAEAGEPALKLARLVDQLRGLRLRGIEGYDGSSQHVKGFSERRTVHSNIWNRLQKRMRV